MENENTSNVYTMPCKPGLVYITLGEECLNDCRFCVKRFGNFFGYSLERLHSDKTLKNVEEGLQRIKGITVHPQEVVICGTGEPFLHYDDLIHTTKKIRKLFGNDVPIRADTSGLWWQKRKDLSFLDDIDSLSISLNAESEIKYNLICQPKISNAYQTLHDFLKTLKQEKQKRIKFPDIRLTIVDTSQREFLPKQTLEESKSECPIPDIDACQKIADSYGFPLVVKKLFRDTSKTCWNPADIEQRTLKGGYLESCLACSHRHI